MPTQLPAAGFFNSITDADGVVRSLALFAEHQGRYCESLALAMLRTAMDQPRGPRRFAASRPTGDFHTLCSAVLREDGRSLALPVDDQLAVPIPFRSRDEASGGSFSCNAASDALDGALKPGALCWCWWTPASGLPDLRVPRSKGLSGRRSPLKCAVRLSGRTELRQARLGTGFDVAQLLYAGLLLAVALPLVSATASVIPSTGVVALLGGIKVLPHLAHGLAIPLATAVTMSLLAFALNLG